MGRVGEPLGQPVRAARRPGRDRDRRRPIATRAAASTPTGRRRAARARTSRPSPPRAASTSTKPMPSCACRCSATSAFFHRLELTGAARYSDYHTNSGRSFSSTTFSAGINWQPIEDLLFRGSWAEGFRAPSIGELFGSTTPLRPGGHRPLQRGRRSDSAGGARPTASPTASRRRQLRAAQRPASGRHRRQRGPRPGDLGELGRRRGLAAELRAAAVGRGQLLQHPGRRRDRDDRRRDPAQPLRDRRRRAELRRDRPLGVGPGHPDPRPPAEHRAASRPTASTSPSTTAAPETGAGTFNLFWSQTFLFNYTVTVPATAGVTVIDREGTEQGSPDQAFPKFKSTGIIDWTMGQFGASLTGRYYRGRRGIERQQARLGASTPTSSCAGTRTGSAKASASRSAPTTCSTSIRRPASPAASTTWTRPPTTCRGRSSTEGSRSGCSRGCPGNSARTIAGVEPGRPTGRPALSRANPIDVAVQWCRDAPGASVTARQVGPEKGGSREGAKDAKAQRRAAGKW